MTYGISLDIGTSGTRGHAVELETGKIISTSVTECHPLPGANIMDHLTFCINVGTDVAHKILIDTVNKLIATMGVDLKQVEKVSICGNPIQLSLFQGIPVDDLAFAGENAHKARGIQEQKRDAGVFSAVDVGLNVKDGCELYVPPSIRHEIGADALAMMYKSGFLEQKENCLVTDYGTNAEMALKIGDEIYTGSAAAGPAFEGFGIDCGSSACRGAIAKVQFKNGKPDASVIGGGEASSISGTGLVSAVSAFLDEGILNKDGGFRDENMDRIYLSGKVWISRRDVRNFQLAKGAVCCGLKMLAQSGIEMKDPVLHLAGGYLISLTSIGRRDYIMLWVVFVKPPYALALQPIFGLIVFDPCIFSIALLLQFSIFIYTYRHDLIKNPIACLSTNISGKIKV